MRSSLLRIALTVFTALAFFNCSSTDVPVSINDKLPDKRLVGLWTSEKDGIYFQIEARTDGRTELTTLVFDAQLGKLVANEKSPGTTFREFIYKGEIFRFVSQKDKEGGYTTLKYIVLDNDRIRLNEIDFGAAPGGFVKKDNRYFFGSTENLAKWITDNLKNPAIISQTVYDLNRITDLAALEKKLALKAKSNPPSKSTVVSASPPSATNTAKPTPVRKPVASNSTATVAENRPAQPVKPQATSEVTSFVRPVVANNSSSPNPNNSPELGFSVKYDPSRTGKTEEELAPFVRQTVQAYLRHGTIKDNSFSLQILERAADRMPTRVRAYFVQIFMGHEDKNWIEIHYDKGLPFVFYPSSGQLLEEHYNPYIPIRREFNTPRPPKTEYENVYTAADLERILQLTDRFKASEKVRERAVLRKRYGPILKKQAARDGGVASMNAFESVIAIGSYTKEVWMPYMSANINGDEVEAYRPENKVYYERYPALKNITNKTITVYGIKKFRTDVFTEDLGYEDVTFEVAPGETTPETEILPYFKDSRKDFDTVYYFAPVEK